MIAWWLLWACESPPPAPEVDARAYIEASQLAASDPMAAAERCAAAGPSLVAECLAQTARVAPLEEGEALCARIEDPIWLDECFFLVAEVALEEEAPAAAATRCARAGRYQDNCLTHLWRLHASQLLAAGDIAAAAEGFRSARSWPGTESMDGRSLDDRMWNKFFEGALSVEDGPVLDIAWCARFPEDLVRSCNRQLPQALRRALTRVDREASQGGAGLELTVLCSEEALQSRILAATGLRYAPSRRLDEVAQQFSDQRCRRFRRR